MRVLLALLSVLSAVRGFTVDLTSARWGWIAGTTYDSASRGIYPESEDYLGQFEYMFAPAARDRHATGIVEDMQVIWVFGGRNQWADSMGQGYYSLLNDLWQYNYSTHQWALIAGTNMANRQGSYPPAPGIANKRLYFPGGRWTTGFNIPTGILIYGMYAIDGEGVYGYLNDVWKYEWETNEWTWLAGNNAVDTKVTNSNGGDIYGVVGQFDGVNPYPGSRTGTCFVSDKQGGIAYLYAGLGFANGASQDNLWGMLGDVWAFNLTDNSWIWIAGPSELRQSGVRYEGNYTVIGVEDESVVPSRRSHHGCSLDSENGYLYAFGGRNFADVYIDVLSDTVRLNLTSGLWTILSGTYMSGDQGLGGEFGVFDETYYPANRHSFAFDWDNDGCMYIYGGMSRPNSYDSTILNYESDLWVFNASIGGWAQVFQTKDAEYAQYYTKGSFCTGATPSKRLGADLLLTSNSDVILSGGWDASVMWDYADFWQFSMNAPQDGECEPLPMWEQPEIPANTDEPEEPKVPRGLNGGQVFGILVAVGLGVGLIGYFVRKQYVANRGTPVFTSGTYEDLGEQSDHRPSTTGNGNVPLRNL